MFVDEVGGTAWLPLYVSLSGSLMECAGIAYSVPERAFARCRARVTEYAHDGKRGRVECAVAGDYAVLLHEYVEDWGRVHYERLCAFLGSSSRCITADYSPAGNMLPGQLAQAVAAVPQLADFHEAVSLMMAAPFIDESQIASLSGRQYGEEEHRAFLAWLGRE